MDITKTHEENQEIIDKMYARGVRSYLDGTPEEIEAVERHRKASPYKIGHEPDYTAIPERLPRKKKKYIKAVIASGIKIPFYNVFFADEKFISKKRVRRYYINSYRVVKSLMHDEFTSKKNKNK